MNTSGLMSGAFYFSSAASTTTIHSPRWDISSQVPDKASAEVSHALAGKSNNRLWIKTSLIFRVVHSVGVPKEVGLTGIDAGYSEHEISVILVPEGKGKWLWCMLEYDKTTASIKGFPADVLLGNFNAETLPPANTCMSYLILD